MIREESDYHVEPMDIGRDAARRNNRYCRAAFLFFAGIFGLLSLSPICAYGAGESPIKENLRICRYEKQGRAAAALYFDDRIVDLERLHQEFRRSSPAAARETVDWQNSLLFLAHGKHSKLARQLLEYFRALPKERQSRLSLPAESVVLLPPVPIPAKFLLLAGNYAEHIEEGGGRAEEKKKTFPYLFWKPPTTTWKGSRAKIPLPSISPDFIDWEIELGVILATECRAMPATRALACVAGYTVVNDISNRRFRPNPGRKERESDGYFDWLHGKWFDNSAPIGPCVISAEDIPDPQDLRLQLKLNGKIQQDSNTRRMIFGVAELIEFISSFVTLEPGDVISTGTPAGVGDTRKLYLRPGDRMEAEIEKIGVLATEITNPEKR